MPVRTLPKFRNLRAFLAFLEERGDLVRIAEPVAVALEATEIHRRVIAAGGPALVFEKPVLADGRIADTPLLTNLFGTVRRVAWGLGIEPERLGVLGEALVELRNPSPPSGLSDITDRLPLARAVLNMRPKSDSAPPCQEVVATGAEVDLASLPVQTCWPGEPAPLITWPVVITRPPETDRAAATNAGVYRMQVLGRDRAIMRWLAPRGGARHHEQWKAKGEDMPVAIAVGTDPTTMLTAAMPLPETVGELTFAGLMSGERPRLARAVTVPLPVPAEAEFVIEGYVSASETAPEGPYGDHTGYYNSVEPFPVMRVTAITRRRDPLYVSTFTGRAPDEPAVIGEAFNEIFVPLVKRQFPEITDFWLPPETASYRVAVVAFRKSYPGHARRLMLGLWSMLPQFSLTKMIVAVDPDVDPRDWKDVMWAVATRSDPSRDLLVLDQTPIDYLDFASPKAGLGGKLGIDATMKVAPETDRPFGEVMRMDAATVARIDGIWAKLGLGDNPEKTR
ncbi:MAG TPA: UbiD family decarboxylase [Hyphomicrobiales bacterium]|nr:UbiD family decarboxylase [Hyphomicrobiales bacterium]